MSDGLRMLNCTLGDVAFESTARFGESVTNDAQVYGVDRSEGLTPDAKYASKNLARYKVLEPQMFAYNPMRLNIGSIAYCTERHSAGLVSPDYVVFGCKPGKLDPKFLSYFIKGLDWRKWTTAAGVGSVRVRIYFRELARMPVRIPPLPQQKAIAAVLAALDDKIELNRRMNATLEAMARALFQSWFVDFDPVRAKLDGREPVGLDQGTAVLFPAFFHETKVGHIPAGWQLGRLADLCNLKRGHDLPTSTRTAGPIPVISSSGISGTHSETNVLGPGVVTGRYGTIGKVFYIETDYWPLNTTLFVDDFKGNPPRFIFHALGEVNFQNYADKAAVPGVNRNHLHEEPMVLPPLELRQAFANSVAPLWAQHATNEEESRILASLRDMILPKLLSGMLKFK